MIPFFTVETSEGQSRLDLLDARAAWLTDLMKELKSEGCPFMNMQYIFSKACERFPEAFAGLDPAAFLFTGRRVVPDEKNFFEWYAGTAEGEKVRDIMEARAPGSFGRFARIGQ